jgi:uncharacterized protein YcfL
MKSYWFSLALLAPALLLSTGCKSTYDHGAYAPVNKLANNLEDNARFVLLDPGAQRSVTCSSIQEGRTSDGRLEVVANVRNRENRRLQVQTQCVFKDAQGFMVEETPWQNLFLNENAQEGIRFVSSNEKAMRYTVRVREAR